MGEKSFFFSGIALQVVIEMIIVQLLFFVFFELVDFQAEIIIGKSFVLYKGPADLERIGIEIKTATKFEVGRFQHHNILENRKCVQFVEHLGFYLNACFLFPVLHI